jgi:hypothetical protein
LHGSCHPLTGAKHGTARQPVSFGYPLLPEFTQEVQIPDLRVGMASLDLLPRRNRHDGGLNMSRRRRKVEIWMVK